MKSMMVRYRVEKGGVETARKAISEFIAMVRMNEAGTLSYDAFQVDETGFVHFMTFRNAQAEQIHSSADYTNKFVDVLYPLCTEQPVFSEIRLVASNRAAERA
jgi:quinol monooxygenase YgiN